MRQVITELEGLRRRGRFMLTTQRAAAIVGAALAIGLALVIFDYIFRLPRGLRAGLLVAGLAALLHALWRQVRPAVFFRPSLTQVALRVERSLPATRGRLASSVEFALAGTDQSNLLAARSVRETETRLAGASLRSVLNVGRTWREAGVGAVIVLVIAGLAAMNPAAAATGLSRLLLPLGATKWPARTGVESMMGGVVLSSGVYPRGQAMPLRARVVRGEEEQSVEARYRLRVDGMWRPWERILLTHQGGGVHERLIDTSAERVQFSFHTDDDQTAAEEIDLEPPPAVRRATLTVTPPSYAASRVPPMQAELGPGVDDRAITEAPSLMGSTVDLLLELNKPLPTGDAPEWIKDTFGWSGDSLPSISFGPDGRHQWHLRWVLEATRTLTVSLIDEHGLTSTEPIGYRIDGIEDRPPSVTVTEPEADEAVLATAVVPLASEAQDDVAIARVGLEAAKLNPQQPVEAAPPAWSEGEERDDPAASLTAAIDLEPLDLTAGDVVIVTGVAQDVYEIDGRRHEAARSAPRRLRIISELELAGEMRRQLSAVRQGAIRIEAMQAEIQDDVIVDGVQPGIDRAQAQIGERITQQQGAISQVQRRLVDNRLKDEQIESLLQQAADLLNFAGRASNRAQETIENRRPSAAPDRSGAAKPADGPVAGQDPQAPADAPPAVEEIDRTERPDRPSDDDSGEGQPGASGDPAAQPGEQHAGAPDDARGARPEDRPIVEAQQEVRDELADLIELLDRDEDTWVVNRKLEGLAEEQSDLAERTAQVGERTMGREAAELTAEESSELDRIADRQRDLREEAQQLIEEMRTRAEAMERSDPQSAAGMRSAAETGEQRELARDMENAAQRIGQNQIRNAQANQQAASSTLQRMLENLTETKRARAEELQRRLSSLIESIQRLIVLQENELTALARARAANDFTGRDRAVIRLSQNTQAVAGEARAAGAEARRVARLLDRAADAQGSAITSLRAQPALAVEAEDAENHSLELLKEAKALAEEVQENAQDEEVRRRREELMAAYRQLLERQVAVRQATIELGARGEVDRRALVESRQLGNDQDQIRINLTELEEQTQEIARSITFTHVHARIERLSGEASRELWNGSITERVTLAQQQIADSLGRLIEALEELLLPPEEFAQTSQGGGQGAGMPPDLIPSVAELRLLRGLQEDVYDETREVDGAEGVEHPARQERLQDLGGRQRELLDLGQEMLRRLQDRQGPTETPEEEQPGAPDPQPPAGDQEPDE
jgi:hypothetical protein